MLSDTTLANDDAMTKRQREAVMRIVSQRPVAPHARLWTRLWTRSVRLHIVLKRLDFWRRECTRIRTVFGGQFPRQAGSGSRDNRCAKARLTDMTNLTQ